MNSTIIGLQIKYHRLAAGMTQKEFAERIGTTWEMVSRYETGKSSPLRKLPTISEVLNVPLSLLMQPQTLEDERTSIYRNTVPLLDKPFTDFKQAVSSTRTYYPAPDWITHTCIRPVALDTGILEIETAQIKEKGIVFISLEKPSGPHDLVVTHNGNQTFITSSDVVPRSRKLLGTIVAWEQRFR